MVDLLLFSGFFVFVCVLLYWEDNVSYAWELRESAAQLLTHDHDDTWGEIQSVEDFWGWVDGFLVPALYSIVEDVRESLSRFVSADREADVKGVTA